MEDKILVYTDQEKHDRMRGYYNSWTRNLQSLVNGLCELSITPSLENVKKLMNGEDLRSFMEDSNVAKHLSFLPKKLLNTIQNTVNNELEEEYNEKVGDLAKRLIHLNTSSDWGRLNIDHFRIDGETVKITEECELFINNSCCVYVDTPSKKRVYDAYLKFIEAYNELEKTIKEAPKTSNPNFGASLCYIDHNKLKALGGYGSYSLVVLNDGELELVGYRFEDIR